MKTTVQNGNVTIPVWRDGAGMPIIFFNGFRSTHVVWNRVRKNLAGKYEFITFDFRGHGQASAADDYSFEAFLSDADTVLKFAGADKPIIVAWSMGADIAVTYAAKHHGKIGGIVVVDGASPTLEPLYESLDDTRKAFGKPSIKLVNYLTKLTPLKNKLSTDDMVNIISNLDAHRNEMMGLLAQADCPITMIMALRPWSERHPDTRRKNNVWKEGIQRLVKEIPYITVKWINDSHRLP
ncbi:MAG: alpha/beta hydrolase, partial [Eubacteriaceae bacterium]|nr:alpha/beta hydrolase [Eubacteriaceae bacterium]